MNYKEQLQATIQSLTQKKDEISLELAKIEEEFANVKLNPYGITSIDFTKRQEMSTDVLKMEGTLMGLTLALETYEESNPTTDVK
jgi:hypothetical protein